ncbi:MAG: hypothetical protein Q7T86_12140 [Hyphomicrobiaceae bacterium]|nr:hypothetical protein [Hyphomicrobiaceae bacterium]
MSMRTLTVASLMAFALTPVAAQANSIGEVENARAKDRSGYHLNRQDREQLRRHGANDDSYGWRGGYASDDGYYDDRAYSGASVYIGPSRDYDDD